MRSPKMLDIECHEPGKPIKWTRPRSKNDIEWYKQMGFLDESGNITEKGWNDRRVRLRPEKLTGTETEEHYQLRLKAYDMELKLFNKWFHDKWENGDKSNYDLPYPQAEEDKIYSDLNI